MCVNDGVALYLLRSAAASLVKKTIDCWPTIPIVVCNRGNVKILRMTSPEAEDSIVTGFLRFSTAIAYAKSTSF